MSEDLTDKLPKNDSEKLNIILTTVRSLDNSVQRLEERADQERYETRLLWEKLQANVADLKQSLHAEFAQMKSEISEIKRSLRLFTIERTHNAQNSSP